MLYGREPKPEDNLEKMYGHAFEALPLELFAEHENFDRVTREYEEAGRSDAFFDRHFRKFEGASQLLNVYAGELFRPTKRGSLEERLAVVRERTYIAGVGLVASLVTFGGVIKQPKAATDIKEMYGQWKTTTLDVRQRELTTFLDFEGARIIADTLFTDVPGSLRNEMIKRVNIGMPEMDPYPSDTLPLREMPTAHVDFDEGIIAALHLIRYYGALRQDIDFNVPNTPDGIERA